MDFYFSKEAILSFDEVMENVKDGLKTEGFRVLTDIDVKATLKKKTRRGF